MINPIERKKVIKIRIKINEAETKITIIGSTSKEMTFQKGKQYQ